MQTKSTRKLHYFVAAIFINLSISFSAMSSESYTSAAYNFQDVNDGKTVAIVFKSQYPLNALNRVAEVMHTRDPAGWINPYWVTNIIAQGGDPEKGCGIVVGTWYANNFLGSDDWFRIIEQRIGNFVDDWAVMFNTGNSGSKQFMFLTPQYKSVLSLKNECGSLYFDI